MRYTFRMRSSTAIAGAVALAALLGSSFTIGPSAKASALQPVIFVGNGHGDTVTMYEYPYNHPISTISSGVHFPAFLAYDPVGGQLFVGNGQGSPRQVEIYAQPFTDTSAPLKSIGTQADRMAYGNGVLALTQSQDAAVEAYAAPFATPVSRKSVNSPSAIAYDPAGHLYVSNCGSTPYITALQPLNGGTYVPPFSTKMHCPRSLAFNSKGELFMADANTRLPGGLSASWIAEFDVPRAGRVPALIRKLYQRDSQTLPNQLLFDNHDDLLVLNVPANGSAGGTIDFYAPPYSGKPSVTLTGFSQPTGMTFDTYGNLLVVDRTSNDIKVFIPPYATGDQPSADITAGIDDPLTVVSGSIAAP